MLWCETDLIIELENKYVDIVHNNATHISNTVMHVVMMYTIILLQFLWLVLFYKYAFHVECNSFNSSKI